MSLLVATRRALLTIGGVTYLLRDEFDDTVAAGSVNGKAATPGPGTRVAVEDDGQLSIGSGVLSVPAQTSPQWDDLGLYYSVAVTRTAGRLLLVQVNMGEADQSAPWVGFNDTQDVTTPTAGNKEHLYFREDGILYLSGITTAVGAYSAATDYQVCVILRATGAYFYIEGGAFTNWTLLGVTATDSSTPLYAVYANYNATFTSSYIRIPDRLFIPPVMVYDSFSRSNGALGDSEAIGPDAVVQAVARTWESGGATWAIASNEAVNTPTEGGELLTNGDMSAWTGDDPDNWVVLNEDVNNYITEVGGGGAAQIVSDNSQDLQMIQVGPLSIGEWTKLELVVSAHASGGLDVYAGAAYFFPSGIPDGTGTFIGATRPASANLNIVRKAACDVTISNISAKQLTLNELFTDVDDGATSDYLAEVELDTVAAYMPTGMVLNLDDKDTPANFVIAYHDGTNAKLDKCVAGTYTSVISAAATYAAGAKLVVIKEGTSYSLYYNSAKIGSTSTVSDAGIISNTKHGLFSTNSGNQLDNFAVFYRTNAAYDTEFDSV